MRFGKIWIKALGKAAPLPLPPPVALALAVALAVAEVALAACTVAKEARNVFGEKKGGG